MALYKVADTELLNNDIAPSEALADVEITNRFIKLAATIKKLAPRSDDFIYFSAIFMHASEASLVDLKTGEPKKDKDGKIITGGFDDKWKWQCSDPTIKAYFNQNMDTFPETELKLAYKKWVGRPLCINHQSSDIEGIRGIIIDTHYDERFKRVVGLCALDKKSYPDLAHKIKSGYANSVSMGTSVSKAICAECGNSAITEKDYCDCMRNKRGEVNIGLSPIELSLVVTPADQQAKVLKIIASVNNYVDQRNSLLEEKDKVESNKLATLDVSIKNVETQLSRLFTECSDNACQFVRESNGHIKMIKVAQAYSWKDFFATAREIESANDYEKHDLFDSLNNMKASLKTEDLRNDNDSLMDFADVMGSKNKYLHETILQPLLEELKGSQATQMQENQFTSKEGPDRDLSLDSGSGITMPANEENTGARQSKVVNPTPAEPKPDKGGDLGPELGAATDKLQFGNMASMKDRLMAKGGKKTADIDENLNLLLRQTQEIEKEMNVIKENLNMDTNNTNTNTTAVVEQKTTASEDTMNESRLKLRAAQRRALLEKRATKCEECDADTKCECGKCDKHCKCEEKKEAAVNVVANLQCKKCGANVADQKAAKVHAETAHKGDGDVTFSDYKQAYWLGTTEPTPGKPQYKPDGGGEPKIRMNDKQMHQDKSMGGADKSFPGDEAEKKKHLRAELEDRALKRRAYWLGTEEPTPGKPQYKADPLNAKLRENGDKQMEQDKSMGGADGSFPGDEAEKKKHLRAELVPGILRTKFTKLRNADGTYNKKGSYFELFAGENKLLKATAEEIYGDELSKPIEGAKGKTGWDVLTSPDYGKEVMAAVRSEGFEKVAYLLKGAQAAPAMPELPPALDGNQGAAPGAGPKDEAGPAQKTEVDANEVMSLVGNMEDTLDRLRTEVTGESNEEVKDMSVENQDTAPAEAVGAELTANLRSLGLEVYAELDRSADELALLVEYFNKSAGLDTAKKVELNKIAVDAVNDGKALLEEAETILAVAGKVPPGLKAFQDKQKGKKKDKGEDKEKGKDKDKKKDEKAKKEDKGKSKDKDKKKSKKAELVEALMKLAADLDGDEDNVVVANHDELDEEMKELGLLPEENKAEDKMCGMCGMAMDKEHYCTASAEKELVREALAGRRMRREALLKAAEEKKYDVQPDDHGMIDEAHKGGGTTTQLDVKPAADGAKVETVDEVHDKMMDAAESAPTGKQGASEAEVKEAAVKAAMETEMKTKKAETDKNAYRVKLRRAYDCGLMMQEKGMITRTKEALDTQVDEIMKFDDQAFESFKRAIANTQSTAAVKTASRQVPQVGVREDNSKPGDNATDTTLVDQLKTLW